MSADADAVEARRYIDAPTEPATPAEAAPPPGPAPDEAAGSSSLGMSLADRVKTRRQALETEQNITLDLPGYEGILAAEFRLLAWTEGRNIGRTNAEEPDEALQLLYTSADCLLTAHVQFFEIDGEDEKPLDDDTWQTLCGRADVRLPAGASARVAMIALLEDVGVMSLWSEYEAWRVTRGRRIAAAVVRGFNKTG
ncbi:MAG: hypothetical protein JWM47_4540 [Acidimicrobiales bacterium]|nr:hypothetical protein [Acidimicrobiales bacterium]